LRNRFDDISAWARTRAPIAERLVGEAKRIVDAIRAIESADTSRCESERGRSGWIAQIDDLAARLGIAMRTRAVRARASNAAPKPAEDDAVKFRYAPERWSKVHFYALCADAVTLLEHLADETGARFFLSTNDGGVIPMEGRWEWETELREGLRGGMDQRVTEIPLGLLGGLEVLVWWPDVSSPPVARPRLARRVDADEDGEAFGAMLGIPKYQEPELETIGWGWCVLSFMGAMEERVFRSSFRSPTGTELREPRYREKGPWSEVDWPLLRRKVSMVRRAILGPLSARLVEESGTVAVFPHVLEHMRHGWRLRSRYSAGDLRLPPDWTY
jgi:hypothetical protein